jgi:hypothetical protein
LARGMGKFKSGRVKSESVWWPVWGIRRAFFLDGRRIWDFGKTVGLRSFASVRMTMGVFYWGRVKSCVIRNPKSAHVQRRPVGHPGRQT